MRSLVANEDMASGKEDGDHPPLRVFIRMTLLTQDLMKASWKTPCLCISGRGQGLRPTSGQAGNIYLENTTLTLSKHLPSSCSVPHSVLDAGVLERTRQRDKFPAFAEGMGGITSSILQTLKAIKVDMMFEPLGLQIKLADLLSYGSRYRKERWREKEHDCLSLVHRHLG